MTTQFTPPPHPFPQPAQPQEPPAPHIRTPMVYVYEKQRWEYRKIEGVLTEEELNTLGADGWELVGVVTTPPATTQFYFKRVRA